MAHDPEPASTSEREEVEEARPPLRDHHEFARLFKITDESGGYNTEPLTYQEEKDLQAFVRRTCSLGFLRAYPADLERFLFSSQR